MVRVPQMQLSQLAWIDLKVAPKELRLDTLRCGQSFRWKQVKERHWACAMQGQLFVLKEDPHTVYYGVTPAEAKNPHTTGPIKTALYDYFQLDLVCLETEYQRWAKADHHFNSKALAFPGIRILRQDPWENLICFICSSNNNITRISQMVDKLCIEYGTKIATLEDEDYYGFPTLDSLATGVEGRLRELGFGYRAKYIHQTAQTLKHDHAPDWLLSLRQQEYEATKTALMTLAGVGPKVADCICLMSMDHAETIPVDTHVWQIAAREYGFSKKATSKTLSPALYKDIADHFRNVFGPFSGWAHSVLFSAELKSFEDKLDHATLNKKRKRTR
ncbi:DNA glycosylase [Hesseltinella vesiculosa]|uniref:N-glycosylase/DNA lyase n=1 Tax=Hesseltinella vesiculosa TaxID=101127 RepID=A0A1X2GHF5_9FUNG|nr:DNA glycosylase [Hesseltinella vesiculosa]